MGERTDIMDQIAMENIRAAESNLKNRTRIMKACEKGPVRFRWDEEGITVFLDPEPADPDLDPAA